MIPILVEDRDGVFRATLFGSPDLQAEAGSKREAIATLQAMVAARVEADRGVASRARSELLWADGPRMGLAEPTWPPQVYDPLEAELSRELVAEIYRERDAQKAREFPE